MRQGYCSLGDLAEEAYDCLKGQTLVSSYTLSLSQYGTELCGESKPLYRVIRLNRVLEKRMLRRILFSITTSILVLAPPSRAVLLTG